MQHESGYDYNAKHRRIENQVQQVVMENAKVPIELWWNAVGRLANWASHNDRYKFVIITHDRFDGDLIAVYWENEESQKKSERPTYTIGAVWHKSTKSYSFHS